MAEGRWAVVREGSGGYIIREVELWEEEPEGTIGRYRKKGQAEAAVAELPAPPDPRQKPLFGEADW